LSIVTARVTELLAPSTRSSWPRHVPIPEATALARGRVRPRSLNGEKIWHRGVCTRRE
jgi:hypothetical protein